MIRAVTRLADSLVGAVAPRATAQAAQVQACHEVSCYCRGIDLYKKMCCDFQPCGSCYYVGPGC
ncbi:hypothetical protein [Micromonospora echinospora]|uniref:hypothetical protein n=1 Tax=Micromonospora echinospora TaxID=1877 RepID=UPI003A84FA4C